MFTKRGELFYCCINFVNVKLRVNPAQAADIFHPFTSFLSVMCSFHTDPVDTQLTSFNRESSPQTEVSV